MYNIANMKKIITTTNAPAPIGPYNQAVLSNGVLYMSGQIPLDPATMELIEGDLEKETIQVMENLKAWKAIIISEGSILKISFTNLE